jgi:hypothetical protein
MSHLSAELQRRHTKFAENDNYDYCDVCYRVQEICKECRGLRMVENSREMGILGAKGYLAIYGCAFYECLAEAGLVYGLSRSLRGIMVPLYALQSSVRSPVCAIECLMKAVYSA